MNEDALSRLPADIAALVSRYGATRQGLGMRFGQGTVVTEEQRVAVWESVTRAERRLVDELVRIGVVRDGAR